MIKCIFHKWGKWEQYSWSGKAIFVGIYVPEHLKNKEVPAFEERQRRKCQRCGKVQDILIRDY